MLQANHQTSSASGIPHPMKSAYEASTETLALGWLFAV